MNTQAAVSQINLLANDWRSWIGVIELFAYRRRARGRFDRGVYQRLYLQLIASCRQLIKLTEGTERVYFEELEVFIRPWLNLEALARTDTVILVTLLNRCRAIEGELQQKTNPLMVKKRIGRSARVIFGIVGLILMLGCTETWLMSHPLTILRKISRQIRSSTLTGR